MLLLRLRQDNVCRCIIQLRKNDSDYQ